MADAGAGQAYGLILEGDVSALALPGLPRGATGRRTAVRETTRAELDSGWPAGARRVATERPEPGAPERTIDEHPKAGWRLDAPGWGLARVARDGALVECVRDGAPTWRWQRFLVGRALPFAAVAAGLEVLHAAAVAHDGRAIAVTGPSGAGKSSVAAALARRGLPLLTDDVLALEATAGGLLAHPGPPVLALRDAEAAALGEDALAELGEMAGEGGGKHYVGANGAQDALPVGLVAVLRRVTEGAVELRRVDAAPARLLLGELFAPEVATRRRILHQLDVLSRVAADVRVVEVAVGRDALPDDVAEALLA